MAREHRADVVRRFWEKVIPEPMSGCWLWLGATNKGYGLFSLGTHHDCCRAHRFSLELTGIEIPAGVLVLHRCDTPLCVNPAHLFLGTQADNMHDMKAKGRARAPRGEANGFSKLTRLQAQSIRERYAAGNVTQESLAKEFAVRQTTISKVVRGIHWRTADAA